MFKRVAAAGAMLAVLCPGIAAAQGDAPAASGTQMAAAMQQQAPAAQGMPMQPGMPMMYPGMQQNPGMYPSMPMAPGMAADPAGAGAQGASQPTYEYIQQAASMSYDGQTLTLEGLAPATIFFSDRPYRLIGQVDTGTFASLWDEPDGTFRTDPPNAAVTVLGSADTEPAIVELTTATVEGSTVRYGVKVLSGELPDGGQDVAVFIDHGPGFAHFGGGGYRPAYHPGYHPYHPYYPPYHPGYHPYHPYYPPYHPYYPPPYYPHYNSGAAVAAGVGALAGAAIGAAAASQPTQVYTYPVPTGSVPANCYLNSSHTRMICSVPLSQPPQ
ncbi:hypothetical protein [Microbaculum marinum]|uniref:Uncharacterized protein n=1 Tax=Microbaculum marinum TaxID=1764581 RepID=A0AAW9RQ70_9HYPH